MLWPFHEQLIQQLPPRGCKLEATIAAILNQLDNGFSLKLQKISASPCNIAVIGYRSVQSFPEAPLHAAVGTAPWERKMNESKPINRGEWVCHCQARWIW